MKTSEVLGVYWDSNTGEVDGQTFYAYSNDINQPPPCFPSDIWHGAPYHLSRLSGEGWGIWLWDIRFQGRPLDWRKQTELTLSYLIEHHCQVCWCGLDGCFSDPPGLFSPAEMSGGVYAAMGLDRRFVCSIDFDDDYSSLTDACLMHLRSFL